MYDCSIIIRAFNEEKHIGKLLYGIQQQTVKNVQTILVDSGSTDRTREIGKEYGVTLVQIEPEQFTFGRSLNYGIENAKAEILVLASAHVYPVYPDWLEHLIRPFEHSKVAICYGKQRGASQTKYSEHQVFKHWFPEFSQNPQDHPFCNNANLAVRKNLWEQHPYDEQLPALEDLAWAKWAFSKGWQMVYAAEAEVIHVHQESWKQVANRYRREGMAFKQINPDARFNLIDLVRLFYINVGADLASAKRENVLSQNIGSILRFRWSQFWGTYLGYKDSQTLLTWQLRKNFYYPNSTVSRGSYLTHPAKQRAPIQYSNLDSD